MLKKNALFICLLLCSVSVFSSDKVEVHTYTSSKGFVFRNFSFTLTPENTVLASDMRLKEHGYTRNASNYRDEVLDEKSKNYIERGQFQIFIPREKFPLKNSSTSFLIARMPQTDLDDSESEKKINRKKQLYERIKTMVKKSEGEVKVVFEFPYPNSDEIDANVFFRTYDGEYIDRVGKL